VVLSPQVWKEPALTALKVPEGASVWPRTLSPQQATVPSVCTPQVWSLPPSTLAARVSAGAVPTDWPESATGAEAATALPGTARPASTSIEMLAASAACRHPSTDFRRSVVADRAL
jgi:hypothetical protein